MRICVRSRDWMIFASGLFLLACGESNNSDPASGSVDPAGGSGGRANGATGTGGGGAAGEAGSSGGSGGSTGGTGGSGMSGSGMGGFGGKGGSAGAGGATPSCDAGPPVGRYSAYEITLPHSSTGVANTWEDVTVVVSFSGPTRTFDVGGFYHSPNTWKARVAPDALGTW